MKNSKICLMALVSVLLGLLAFAQATPPERINYQGVVRDSLNNPLNGLVTMTFRFYDDPSAGTMLWEEIYDPTVYPPQLTVSGGLFTVELGDAAHRNAGSETDFTTIFANHADVYLAVRVAADAEMTPRVKVIATPYAVNSAKLEGRAASAFANTSHTHAGTDITSVVANATHAVTADSATNATNATNCTNADTVDSQHATYFLDTSSTAQTKTGKVIFNNAASSDYGIEAHGTDAGGYFKDSNSSAHAYVGYGDEGIRAVGTSYGGYFNGSGSGFCFAGYGEVGVDGHGYTKGGQFWDSNSSGFAHVGYGDEGIEASGYEMGGYFRDSDHSGYAYVGYGDYGILGMGNTYGGRFQDLDNSGYANVAAGDWGIRAYGNEGGAHCYDLNSSAYGDVGYDTYKITGNGTVSFVQNHPTEKDKVIVYACPEGDEVATYTRGTAKLVNGEARVKLGETFQWVTNPDIGLTASLAPRGDCKGLYVESLSTNEIIVKELNGGNSNAAFDYVVYGLRIGFEESSIVQEKQQESYIPSFKNHRERYAKYPGLRTFNALERFKGMESSVRGVAESSIDLSSAKALKDAIHEYDPATDPPAEKRSDMTPPSPAKEPDRSSHPVVFPVPPPPAMTTQTVSTTEPFAINRANDTVVEKRTELPCFQVSEAVDTGEIVVIDPSGEGFVIPCRSGSDPMVVGIAADSAGDCRSGVSVATSGVVLCKADAGYGFIRRGDLLVASPTPGHAMKAIKPIEPGTVVGKALEPLESGTGLIKIVVMLR